MFDFLRKIKDKISDKKQASTIEENSNLQQEGIVSEELIEGEFTVEETLDEDLKPGSVDQIQAYQTEAFLKPEPTELVVESEVDIRIRESQEILANNEVADLYSQSLATTIQEQKDQTVTETPKETEADKRLKESEEILANNEVADLYSQSLATTIQEQKDQTVTETPKETEVDKRFKESEDILAGNEMADLYAQSLEETILEQTGPHRQEATTKSHEEQKLKESEEILADNEMADLYAQSLEDSIIQQTSKDIENVYVEDHSQQRIKESEEFVSHNEMADLYSQSLETTILEQTGFARPQPSVPVEEPDKSKSWFGLTLSSLKEKISKTTEALISNVISLTKGKEVLDDEVLDDIEETLIKADIGLDAAVNIVYQLRENKNKITPDKLKDYLREEFSKILLAGNTNIALNLLPNKLNIYLITGVNGVGKTTLIGKMAYRFKEQGKKVLIAAGDTFRAAAEEQLNIWSDRAGADIVRRDGADPASVIYDAIVKAQRDYYDILLVDTAGRLHNKINLMEELKKIKRTIDKNAEGSLAESILVLDATTGQNGLQQAAVFAEAVQLTSVALTKLDGSAKGGIIIAIASEMQLPVKLVGVGEKIDDLRDFDPNMFIEALFE